MKAETASYLCSIDAELSALSAALCNDEPLLPPVAAAHRRWHGLAPASAYGAADWIPSEQLTAHLLL